MTPSFADVTDGLVSWWKFEETSGTISYDASIYFGQTAFNMGQQNTPTPVAGKMGGALEFVEASSEYLTKSSYTALNSNTGITICAWSYLDSLGGTSDTFDGGIFNKESSAVSAELILFWYNVTAVSSGDHVYTFNVGPAGTASNRINGNTEATALVWEHVCGVMDGANRYLYMNGKLDASGVSSGTTSYSGGTDAASIGAWTTVSSNYYFDGKLDDIRVYNRNLSAGEIWEIYQGASQNFGGE